MIFKRTFDIFFSSIFILIFFIPMLFIYLIIIFSSRGGGIHWSRRIGLNNSVFFMPKFRTMIENSPDVATHKLKDNRKYVTGFGRILRKTSLDEIPQFFSVFLGKMSFVGPRPALHNQDDLIKLRTLNGIHKIKPGITGLAQISGRDNLSIEEKVSIELEYLSKKSFVFDIKIIFKTVFIIFKLKNISH